MLLLCAVPAQAAEKTEAKKPEKKISAADEKGLFNPQRTPAPKVESDGRGGEKRRFDNENIRDEGYAPFYKIRPDFKPAEHAADIARVEDFLNNMRTLEARFNQINPPMANLSQGKIYIQRPGKLRWDYEAPEKLQIMMNKNQLIYYDVGLDQVTYRDVDSELTKLLTQDKVTFSNKLKVVDIRREPGTLVAVLQNTGTEPGWGIDEIIALVFSDDPVSKKLMLRRMHLTNHVNETIQIDLVGAKLNQPIDPSIFVFKNPRLLDKKKR